MAGVGDTGHSRRQHIVDRLAGCVFLDVHYRHIKLALRGSIASAVEVEVVGTPLATHQLEGCEAQVCGLPKAGEEHSGEADRREIGNRADNLLIVAQRNFELIPLHLEAAVVARGHYLGLFVGDIVLAHHKVFGAD